MYCLISLSSSEVPNPSLFLGSTPFLCCQKDEDAHIFNDGQKNDRQLRDSSRNKVLLKEIFSLSSP